jgi:formylglycine-generating enzyme required for sulfatase activity
VYSFPNPQIQIPSPINTPQLKTFEFETVRITEIENKGLFGWNKTVKTKRIPKQAQYFTENLGNGITLDMVYIPSGTFMMGSPGGEGYDREKPRHQVTVAAFFMGKYPVTQEQWWAIASRDDLQVKQELHPEPAGFKGSSLPVECVNWHDAEEFCGRLSRLTGKQYRLPSEAEWEYACRAGTITPFYFGETMTSDLANYDGNYTYAGEAKGKYRQRTTPVGKFPPNAFGLYDMHGNVWEWCEDDWHESYEGAPTGGSAWITKGSNRVVVRGGSWDDNPDYCRSANRSNSNRRGGGYKVGFRVVWGFGRTL